MKRAGFTMIELIFVIVILGILAAVAIPKLAATRNDAKIASDVTSAAQGIQNLGAEFTAQGAFNNYTVNDAQKSVKCFDFTLESATDGNVSLAVKAAATTSCPQAVLDGVKTRAVNNGLTDTNGTKKYYVFGGTGVAE